jgi:putative FmdB family regulatory protein
VHVPTYAYRCTVCEHAFDVQQSFTDDALTVCPRCEGRLRKVFSPVGVVFKGSGFYRTDARAGGRSSAVLPASGSSSSDTGSTGSGDSGSSGSGSGGSGSSGSGSSGSGSGDSGSGRTTAGSGTKTASSSGAAAPAKAASA